MLASLGAGGERGGSWRVVIAEFGGVLRCLDDTEESSRGVRRLDDTEESSGLCWYPNFFPRNLRGCGRSHLLVLFLEVLHHLCTDPEVQSTLGHQK